MDKSLAAGYNLDMHHPDTVAMLGPGTLLRAQVEAMADDQDWAHDAEELALERARMKLIPLAERTLGNRFNL